MMIVSGCCCFDRVIVSGCMATRLLIVSGSIGTESSDGNDRV